MISRLKKNCDANHWSEVKETLKELLQNIEWYKVILAQVVVTEWGMTTEGRGFWEVKGI
jgi:hypothetical protein